MRITAGRAALGSGALDEARTALNAALAMVRQQGQPALLAGFILDLFEAARAFQQSEAGRATLRERVAAEHSLARLGQLGIGQARYVGRKKTRFQLLLAATVIIVLSRLVGAAFRRINQPQVVGEIVAGVMLGPSLLGAVWPHAQRALFPSAVLPFIDVLAQIGLIVFML